MNPPTATDGLIIPKLRVKDIEIYYYYFFFQSLYNAYLIPHQTVCLKKRQL